MTRTLKIDFVSDISCPWCAIGLAALEQALDKLKPELSAELHFQPFELNPQMPPGGQDIGEHLAQKYGSTPEQQAQIRDTIRQRGADVGFSFNLGGRGRIYNTLDAHRLLHWAGLEQPALQPAADQLRTEQSSLRATLGPSHKLKQALLAACHTRSEDMESHAVLLRAVEQAGLDAARASAILQSDEFAAEVREREAFYTGAGIHSVPAVIINDQQLISGGQPAAVFEQALRQIAAAAAKSRAQSPTGC